MPRGHQPSERESQVDGNRPGANRQEPIRARGSIGWAVGRLESSSGSKPISVISRPRVNGPLAPSSLLSLFPHPIRAWNGSRSRSARRKTRLRQGIAFTNAFCEAPPTRRNERRAKRESRALPLRERRSEPLTHLRPTLRCQEGGAGGASRLPCDSQSEAPPKVRAFYHADACLQAYPKVQRMSALTQGRARVLRGGGRDCCRPLRPSKNRDHPRFSKTRERPGVSAHSAATRC